MTMLINGRLWSHKKRDNLRMMKDFAVRAIGCLERERNSLGDHFEQYCVHYYDLTKVYCIKDEDLRHMQSVFQERLKLDIVAVENELNPFAPASDVAVSDSVEEAFKASINDSQ